LITILNNSRVKTKMIIFKQLFSGRIDWSRKHCNDFEKSIIFSIRVQYSENIYFLRNLYFQELFLILRIFCNFENNMIISESRNIIKIFVNSKNRILFSRLLYSSREYLQLCIKIGPCIKVKSCVLNLLALLFTISPIISTGNDCLATSFCKNIQFMSHLIVIISLYIILNSCEIMNFRKKIELFTAMTID
jgi:hypothetical protein